MSERQLLLSGAILTPLGIVLALVAGEMLGALVMIVGVGFALLGLHRFGRSGADTWSPPSDEASANDADS